ncbi:hypothetical protein LRAMOSA06414 [Lichtheimia ramosa]|uniref:General negative regulator of transcription subunit n=1 Tax=Lichtheimia ramosa TaxID=688394 RepID=A0A077X426_9FUNG|nr:hypothetical protein LRAMOSA06414 [Lichtheimia ramosa]
MNQKEKYEQDLKKEIKKLQRLRDQIKTWLSSNEIKDKRALLENRKLIELQMERFKTIEKEMKTKAYSKEGLMLKEKMDPKEKEKMDVCEWITTTKIEIERQMEATEAEIETLQGTSKRGKKDHSRQERISELEHHFERNKYHLGRLELILRLLENDHLPVDKVAAIKDDVQYYVESNQDPDFEEDEYMYDDLNLEEEEELYPITTDDYFAHNETKPEPKEEDEKPHSKRAAREKERQERVKEKEREKEKEKEEETTPQKILSPKSKDPLTPSLDEPKSAKSNGTSPLRTPSSTRSTPEVTAPTTTGLKYAQAAAAGVSTSGSHDSLSKKQDKIPGANDKPVENAWTKPPEIIDQAKEDKQRQHVIQQPGASLLSSQYPTKSPDASSVPPDMSEARLPSSLADLAPAFEAVKAKGIGKADMMYTHQMLDTSLQHVPDLIDSERPKQYQPVNPYPTPNYYPQQPLAVFDNPVLFEKFDMDALFFIFYYQQGTYQQYLAARELKKQSWRFHKKYLTWFQRHEEPKVITDDYEQGTYIYFDYEGSWCQRKKTDFRFEYRYLEEA